MCKHDLYRLRNVPISMIKLHVALDGLGRRLKGRSELQVIHSCDDLEKQNNTTRKFGFQVHKIVKPIHWQEAMGDKQRNPLSIRRYS